MSRVHWPLTPVVELAAERKWAINGGPFGSKLVSRDYVDSGVPVIRGANLPFGKRFHSDDFVFVSEEKADELLANNAHPGDVIITQRGTLGQVGIIPLDSTYPRYVISQSQMKITVDPARVDADWLYYCFRSPIHQNELINRASSSGVPHINLGVLREFKLPLPDLPTQRRIASILSAYDDLIENNTRRIAILQEMARRIYEEWFVHFRFPGHDQVKMVESDLGLIPEGWSIATVNDAVERHSAGKRYDQSSVQPVGMVPVLDQGKSGVIGYHNESPGVVAALSDPIIVFANHTCYQRLMFESFSAIQNVIPFKSSKRFERNIYWLHYSTDGLVKLNDYKGHWPQFAAAKITVPRTEIADEFGSLVAPFLHLCLALRKKNANLRSTRDLLLPKLISGELDVSTLDESEENLAA